MEEHVESAPGAGVLEEGLIEIYRDFEDKITRKDEGEKTFLSVLRNLFSDKRDTDEYVRAFHNAVGEHITKFHDALKEEEPDTASEIAERSARMMLIENGQWNNSVISLSRLSNQGFAAPLLEFLTKEQLNALREEYLKGTPKRLMFPNQRTVLDEMERLLQQ